MPTQIVLPIAALSLNEVGIAYKAIGLQYEKFPLTQISIIKPIGLINHIARSVISVGLSRLVTDYLPIGIAHEACKHHHMLPLISSHLQQVTFLPLAHQIGLGGDGDDKLSRFYRHL